MKTENDFIHTRACIEKIQSWVRPNAKKEIPRLLFRGSIPLSPIEQAWKGNTVPPDRPPLTDSTSWHEIRPVPGWGQVRRHSLPLQAASGQLIPRWRGSFFRSLVHTDSREHEWLIIEVLSKFYRIWLSYKLKKKTSKTSSFQLKER